jgi:hypothetical protein
MRRITQNTISDRIFGIRQDRQGVAVVGIARCMTVLLVLLSKRGRAHFGRKLHALEAWLSAGLMPSELIGWQPPSRQCVAPAYPVRVEAVNGGRC